MKLGRLQVHWWGFFTRDECESCGRGHFDWFNAFRIRFGVYHPLSLTKPFMYWVAFGPLEFRWLLPKESA